jgi:HEAT repeat protein
MIDVERLARTLLCVLLVLLLVAGCGPNVERLLDEGDVQGLIDVLNSDADTQVRADAAAALGQLDAVEATAAIAAALDDPEEIMRAAAADALGALGQATTLLPLLVLLDDDAAEVRDAAERALAALADEVDRAEAASELVAALDDDSPTVRAAAADMLGGLGKQVALLPLLARLDDEDAEVRDAAERTLKTLLGDLPGGVAARGLIEALQQDSPVVRATAAGMLGELGERSGMAALFDALDDSDEQVRSAATHALAVLLGRLPPRVAVRALLGRLDDERPEVRAVADIALRKLLADLGPQEAGPTVQDVGGSEAWLAVALNVSEEQLSVESRRMGIQLEPLDTIRDTAAVARDGTAVAGTRPYTPSGDFHPAVVLGTSAWDQCDAWAPTALSFLELVIVADDVNWQSIQVCPYNGPNITRFRGMQSVRVLSAQSGEQVAERVFQGADPRDCQQQEPWNLTELYGEDPDLGEAVSWLESIINPPS